MKKARAAALSRRSAYELGYSCGRNLSPSSPGDYAKTFEKVLAEVAVNVWEEFERTIGIRMLNTYAMNGVDFTLLVRKRCRAAPRERSLREGPSVPIELIRQSRETPMSNMQLRSRCGAHRRRRKTYRFTGDAFCSLGSNGTMRICG